MEASALTHAQKRGLFARRSPLLKFQDDPQLVALVRKGHQHAFDTLVERYQSRLLGFCRQMLGSTQDAEDVLQEVFVAAYNAMLADEREIAVRPWLYRIARNRCLNHLRRPTADGVDTMDTMPHMNGVTTLERVQDREEFRSLLEDVCHLPETQRSALLLREIDAMSYEEIAQAMDTTVPGVKSLLVRARIALAESTQARKLTCDEVRVHLAEAAEGLAKLDGPARRHVKACEQCADFRKQLRSDSKVLAALFPAGPLLALKAVVIGKLSGLIGGGGAGAAGGGGAASAGAGAACAGAGAAGGTAATGAAAVGGAAAATGAGAAGAGAAGAVGAAIGTKAAAGLATAALIAGGAAEIKHVTSKDPAPAATVSKAAKAPAKPEPIVQQAAPAPLPAVTPEVAAPPVDAAPEEVVVEPVPTDEAVADDDIGTGGVAGASKGAKKHKEPIANTDGGKEVTAVGGPVTTGIEASCDADGDGVADPSCAGGTTTGLEQVAPPPPAPAVKQTIKRLVKKSSRGSGRKK